MAFSPEEVQKIIEGKDKKVLKQNEKYISDFKLMEELAKILKTRRMEKGYLNLDIPESKFELDIDVMMENVKTKSRLQLSEIRWVDMQRLDLRKPFSNVLSTRKEIINYVEEHLLK